MPSDFAATSITITYLQITEPPERQIARPLPEDAVVVRASPPTVSFYRYLYNTVGEPWHWHDRRRLSDAELEAIVTDPRVEVQVLYLRGTPAGYAELDRRVRGEVELAYFGLLPEFTGRGIGPALLDWTIDRAWASSPARLWVHTCTLDSPRALPVYLRAGFRVYREETLEGGTAL